MAPWCSGLTCQPVTLEIEGSNPFGVAIKIQAADGLKHRPFLFTRHFHPHIFIPMFVQW